MSSYNQKPLLTVSSAKSIRAGSQPPLQALSRRSEVNNLVRYAGPLDTSLNSDKFLQLTIPARHPEFHYKAYSYFGVHTRSSPRRKYPAFFDPLKPSTAHEWMTRDRRCVAFVDTSGLTPIVHGPYEQPLRDRVHQCIRTDHMTSWVSGSGAEFLLNEPYVIEDDYRLKLKENGFSAFQLPINISPYCGMWAKDAGSPPGSRSYLITSSANSDELGSIREKLSSAAFSLPAWNDVSGIRYV